MFFTLRKRLLELRDKQLDLVDQEVELYRREKKTAVDNEMLQYRQTIADLAREAADDTAKHEHDYHQNMQDLGIKIAKLEAKKEHLEAEQELWLKQKQILSESNQDVFYQDMLDAKDQEIERLNVIIEKLIESLPETPEINVCRK